jgi:Methyltransferase domain
VKTARRAKVVTGKITACPNPVYFGQNCTVISWQTDDPAGAEVRVLPGTNEEQLVTRKAKSGQVEIPWIKDSGLYEFRLYGASQPDVALDSVKVRRAIESAPVALDQIADELNRGNIDMEELSGFIENIIPRCLRSRMSTELFRRWERRGFHVTPVHFYRPIPDTQSLPEILWTQPSSLPGIQMNESAQLKLLREDFSKFRNEYEQLARAPSGRESEFYVANNLFGGVDALVAYCMARHFQPRLVVEVGSGFSSLVLGQAIQKNQTSGLICIEPYPRKFLRDGFPGLQTLIEKNVQDIELEFFSQLQSGDVLFIDSSHTVKIGSDVNYLFLEVLPRLRPGVVVHVHDIFLPFEYRRDWVVDELRFWNEQYLLQAFLQFNSEFEVLMANSYLNHYRQDDLKAAFPDLTRWEGGSFWMRRRPSGASYANECRTSKANDNAA